MKKLLLLMLVASCASGCGERPQPLTIDNSLTAEEIKAGVFTPEVMWKMGRIGSAVLSPDGNALAYTVTYYNMEENRGVTAVYVRDMVSGGSSQLTDFASNNADPKWSADGSRLYFGPQRFEPDMVDGCGRQRREAGFGFRPRRRGLRNQPAG